MSLTAYKKLFGVGPLGAFITLVLFFSAWLFGRKMGHTEILNQAFPLRCAGTILIAFGLFLHMWTFFTLKNWWRNDQLCTMGPFRYVRHPMYAAWVSFVSMGVALTLNSWVYVFWALLLHPVWHVLAGREEKIVENVFGDEYRRYAERTGRFVPRFCRRSATPK